MDSVLRGPEAPERGGSTLATYQYAGSRVPSLALPNNVTRTQTYDALLRSVLVEYKRNTTSQKKFEYVYNLADYRLLEKRHHSGGTGDNYDLDSIYRSVNVKAGVADPVAEYQNPGSQTVTSTTGVAYDAAQSRSQVIVTAGGTPTTTNYTSDALNFYTAVGGTTHVRDANGNLRDDGTNLYDYDHRDQLVRIRRKSDLSVIGTYDYDGLCRRVAKSTSAGTISFHWIGFELAMEFDGSGLVSRRHRGAGFNEVVSAQQRDIADLDQDGSTTDYVPLTPLYDGAYDCIGVLDHTGAVAESYVHTYDGAVTITNAAGGTIPTSAVGWQQGYSRLYSDSESGFLYAVRRYYDPTLGRFVTEDPLGTWEDTPNAGNARVWLGNTYRNGADPLGLAKKAKKGCCGQKWGIIIADWGHNWFDRALGARKAQASDIHFVKRGMAQVGITRFAEVHFDGRKHKKAEDARIAAEHLLDACAKDPCCTGVAFFGHGSSTDGEYTGGMDFDRSDPKDSTSIPDGTFLGQLDHGLDACFMGMCGADAGGWSDSVHEGGTYEGGVGSYWGPNYDGSHVASFVAGTTRQSRR